MSKKLDIVVQSLEEYYKDPAHELEVQQILERKDVVTQRMLDHLVFHYARQHPCEYGQFNIQRSLDTLLKTVQRKHFDPFRRRPKQGVEIAVGRALRSTVAQLLFFKWVQQNGVLEFARQHADEIRDSMRLRTRKRKLSPSTPTEDAPV
jgi:hypothetical protein